MEHLRLTKENLRKEVLDEIVKESKLIHCPYCASELKNAECELNPSLPTVKAYDPNQRWKKCDHCRVIWVIKLRKWENERGDGMVTDSGYSLDLKGYTNCFCRQSVFEYGVLWLDEHHPRSSLPFDSKKSPQEDIQLNYLYPLEEMGHVPMPEEAPHWMLLHKWFIRDKNLQTSNYAAEIKKLTNVTCPFCKVGVLRLIKAEPFYSGGLGSRPSALRHVGDDLEYDCSNEKCDAKFEGRTQWTWID
jgi:hypothetical protein